MTKTEKFSFAICIFLGAWLIVNTYLLSIPDPLPTATELQTRLVEAGYDIGPNGVDGQLGPDTDKALKQYHSEKECEYHREN